LAENRRGPETLASGGTGSTQVGFSELFMADLLNRNSRIEEDLIDQLFNSSEKRLARVLLLLANFGKEATTEPIIGKFSQETLAEMIGTTRSRVSFFMNKFRKLGYIEYNGKLEIVGHPLWHFVDVMPLALKSPKNVIHFT
jgi:CRP/FNR family cyclic AMP-dependent transcriptional regulator